MTIDNIFKNMAAQGQSFFEASGDSDAYTGNEILGTSQSVAPMDSPFLTSVGGTTLSMNGAGAAWSSETVWNYNIYGGTYANIGSGGGISTNYPIPDWQTNVSMAANQGSTTNRNIPDVALDRRPNLYHLQQRQPTAAAPAPVAPRRCGRDFAR